VLVLCYVRDRDEDDLSRAVHNVPELRIKHVARIHVMSEPVTYLRACYQVTLRTGVCRLIGCHGVREALLKGGEGARRARSYTIGEERKGFTDCRWSSFVDAYTAFERTVVARHHWIYRSRPESGGPL